MNNKDLSVEDIKKIEEDKLEYLRKLNNFFEEKTDEENSVKFFPPEFLRET